MDMGREALRKRYAGACVYAVRYAGHGMPRSTVSALRSSMRQGRLDLRDFLARVDALAAGLAALPLVKGERLCILAQNHPAYLELYGACARLGVIAYPINWRLTAEEIRRIVERAAPRLLLVDDSTLPAVADWPQHQSGYLPLGTPWAPWRRQASSL